MNQQLEVDSPVENDVVVDGEKVKEISNSNSNTPQAGMEFSS